MSSWKLCCCPLLCSLFLCGLLTASTTIYDENPARLYLYNLKYSRLDPREFKGPVDMEMEFWRKLELSADPPALPNTQKVNDLQDSAPVGGRLAAVPGSTLDQSDPLSSNNPGPSSPQATPSEQRATDGNSSAADLAVKLREGSTLQDDEYSSLKKKLAEVLPENVYDILALKSRASLLFLFKAENAFFLASFLEKNKIDPALFLGPSFKMPGIAKVEDLWQRFEFVGQVTEFFELLNMPDSPQKRSYEGVFSPLKGFFSEESYWLLAEKLASKFYLVMHTDSTASLVKWCEREGFPDLAPLLRYHHKVRDTTGTSWSCFNNVKYIVANWDAVDQITDSKIKKAALFVLEAHQSLYPDEFARLQKNYASLLHKVIGKGEAMIGQSAMKHGLPVDVFLKESLRQKDKGSSTENAPAALEKLDPSKYELPSQRLRRLIRAHLGTSSIFEEISDGSLWRKFKFDSVHLLSAWCEQDGVLDWHSQVKPIFIAYHGMQKLPSKSNLVSTIGQCLEFPESLLSLSGASRQSLMLLKEKILASFSPTMQRSVGDHPLDEFVKIITGAQDKLASYCDEHKVPLDVLVDIRSQIQANSQ